MRQKEIDYKEMLQQGIESFTNINKINNYITQNIKKSAKQTVPNKRTATTNSKISKNTIPLISYRNKHKENTTDEELRKKNKHIRNRVRKDNIQ